MTLRKNAKSIRLMLYFGSAVRLNHGAGTVFGGDGPG